MKTEPVLTTALIIAITLGGGGCENTPLAADRQTVGTVAGGALGAAVGSQIGDGSGRTAAIIGGAVLGGVLGNAIGQRMDEGDRRRFSRALEENRLNESNRWTNPDTGYEYVFTPTRTFEFEAGQPCRDFDTQVYYQGERQTVQGIACRRADGVWEVIN